MIVETLIIVQNSSIDFIHTSRRGDEASWEERKRALAPGHVVRKGRDPSVALCARIITMLACLTAVASAKGPALAQQPREGSKDQPA